MLIALNKEFGFNELGDFPEKIIYFMQRHTTSKFYIEDIIDFLLPDVDETGISRFHHTFH